MAKKKTDEVTESVTELKKEIEKYQGQTAEQFLISKGIDPPIKSAPIQNLTFEKLCVLMTEYAFI